MLDTLADELWLLIFKEYISQAEEAWIPSYCSHSTTGPFVLSAVNASWRRICLSNWAVWDTIFISFPQYKSRNHLDGPSNDAEESLQTHIDALKLWIERAGENTIWLAYWMDDETFDFSSQRAMQIPHIVVDNADRIRKLDMWAFSERWYSLLSGVSFPVLEHFCIAVPELLELLEGGVSGRSLTEQAPLDLTRCPLLTSIDITGSPKEHSGIVLPWAQIDDLTIRHVDLTDIIEVLDLMSNLKSCAFDLPWGYDLWDCMDAVDALKVRPRMDRPNSALRILRMGGMAGEGLGGFLGYLPLGLTHLEMNFNDDLPPLADAAIIPPVLEFSDTLKVLIIKDYAFGKGLDAAAWEPKEGEWDVLLDAFPKLLKLEELELILGEEGYAMDDSTFAEAFSSPGTLPGLKRLRLSVPEMVNDKTLLEFLQYRRHTLPTEGGERQCVLIEEVVIVPENAGAWNLNPLTLAEVENVGNGRGMGHTGDEGMVGDDVF